MQEDYNIRGYACIGLQNPKNDYNVGHALRAAGCFGANMVVISGVKYSETFTDTQKSYKHIPLLEVDDLECSIPYDCVPVAVEMLDNAIPLHDYVHPERAFYIFGAETGMLDSYIVDYCKDVIAVPSRYCLNLGACVNVVLYDRLSKQLLNDRRSENRKKFFTAGLNV